MDKIYDLVIAGSGPAGLAAGIYAGRAELDTLIVEKSSMSGGQIINTYEVDNYPGIPGIGGFELAEKFRSHCEEAGSSFIEGEVESFAMEENIKVLTLDTGEKFKSRTLIIATGAQYRKLGVKGEKEFAGLGVSYCATCDGAFFKNKVTAVVGGGDVALEDAIFLCRICKKVYVIHRRNEFRAAKSLVTRLEACENAEVIWDSTVEEIIGDEVVTGLRIKHAADGRTEELTLSGVFIAVGNMPNSEAYKPLIEMDDSGYIIAGETCETNIPGVLAAGDVRTKALKQIITAAADGANAITTVEKYLNSL